MFIPGYEVDEDGNVVGEHGRPEGEPAMAPPPRPGGVERRKRIVGKTSPTELQDGVPDVIPLPAAVQGVSAGDPAGEVPVSPDLDSFDYWEAHPAGAQLAESMSNGGRSSMSRRTCPAEWKPASYRGRELLSKSSPMHLRTLSRTNGV